MQVRNNNLPMGSESLYSIYNVNEVEEVTRVNVEDLRDHICGTSVGGVLDSVDTEKCEEFFDFYLHDFVRSIHMCTQREPTNTDMEYQVLIVACIVSLARLKGVASEITACRLANLCCLVGFQQFFISSSSVTF